MEEVIVVDREDAVLGSKPRSEMTPEDIRRSTALWLTNENDEILIAQRALTKPHSPGLWGPAAAGVVAKGEMYDSNIRKEVREELGVNLELVTGPKAFVQSQRPGFVQWYLATVHTSSFHPKLQEEEVAAITWISFEDLRDAVATKPRDYMQSMPQWVELFKK